MIGGNRRGRHDELGYRSSDPKASAAQGRSVYDRVWEGVSNGHHDREKRKKYLLQIDAIAFIVHVFGQNLLLVLVKYRFVMTSC